MREDGVKVKVRINKEMFHKDDYFILSATPLESNRDIVLNKWGSISIVGNVGYLIVDNEYEVILKEGKPSKYGLNYEVLECPTLVKQELDKLDYDSKFSIMRQATSSDKIATNILTAYPNFINDVVTMTDEELNDVIDLKKIKGVGKAFFKAYKRILRDKFQYFTFVNRDAIKPYELNAEDAKALFKIWNKVNEAEDNFLKNPY